MKFLGKVFMVTALSAIMVAAMYATYADLTFFINEKTGVAILNKVAETDGSKDVMIELSYYNYQNKKVTSSFKIKHRFYEDLKSVYRKPERIKIFYSNKFPYEVYIEKYKPAPRYLILVFEIFIVLLMAYSIYLSVNPLKSKKANR